jgi:enoyl-CoA hydratase
MSISLEHQGPVSMVTLGLPPMNLLTIDVMDELVALHQEADANPDTRVIVTASAIPGMFSNGLNPVYVLKRDNPARVDVFRGVGRLLHGLLSLNKPHIAAINGPAMAGGAILAITADFRFMIEETGRLCFSEPKVGLPIPEAVTHAIAAHCSPAYLREVVMLGKNMDAATAFKFGLADGLAPDQEGLQALVEKQVGRLARLSPRAMAETKRGIRADLLAKSEKFQHDPGNFADFVADEFLGEGLQALVEQRQPVFKV